MGTTNEPERAPALRRFWEGWRREILRGLVLFVMVLGVGLAVHRAFFSGRKAFLSRFGPDIDIDLGGPRQAGDTFHWQGKVSPSQWLYLRSTLGAITVTGGTGDQVEVTAVKSWRRSDPQTVHVVAVRKNGSVTICALWETAGESCGPQGEYQQHGLRGNDVAVEFTVRVPRGVKVDAHTVNGAVQMEGVDAPVAAATVNGGIDVSTARGPVSAATVNGHVDVAMRAFAGPGDVGLVTVNGAVSLALPANVDADVDASTVAGSIQTEFPLTVSGRFAGRRLEGKLGAGGRRVHITTVHGSINLTKIP